MFLNHEPVSLVVPAFVASCRPISFHGISWWYSGKCCGQLALQDGTTRFRLLRMAAVKSFIVIFSSGLLPGMPRSVWFFALGNDSVAGPLTVPFQRSISTIPSLSTLIVRSVLIGKPLGLSLTCCILMSLLSP